MAERPLGFSFLYFTPPVRHEHYRWFGRRAHHGYGGKELPVVEASEQEILSMKRALDAEGLAAAERAKPLAVLLAVEPLNRSERFLLTTAAEVTAPGAAGSSAGSLGHVQLSENHRGTPGTGQVDFGRVLGALDDIGYGGWLVVEAFSRLDPGFGSALRIWRPLDGGAEEVLAAGAAVARR